MSAAVFPRGLTGQQARGLSCIVCNTPYDVPGSPASVPVGFAHPDDGGGQVFACDEPDRRCAAAVGYVPPAQLQIGAGR